jgi:hypothetical protein
VTTKEAVVFLITLSPFPLFPFSVYVASAAAAGAVRGFHTARIAPQIKHAVNW